MKFLLLSLLFFSAFAQACPEGTHSVTKTESSYVCQPVTEYKCDFVTSVDPATGESKTEYVCNYVTDTKCEFVTSSHEECVPDSSTDPIDPGPITPGPAPKPLPPPATIDSLKEGDSVKTRQTTNLQIGTKVLQRLPPGKLLKVEKVDASGWFWTEVKTSASSAQKGWVKVPHVYIVKP